MDNCAGVIATVPLVTCGPDESSSLESFRKKTQTIARPPQKFDQISSPPAKHKHLSRKRILLKRRLHHSTQAGKSAPQIRHACSDPNPRSRWKPDHPSKHSSTVRSASASTLPVSRSCPFGSCFSIVPEVHRGATPRTCPD